MKIFFLVFIFSLNVSAQTRVDKKNRIIYKYKKYEKFDFEDLVIEGETGSPGDISSEIRTNIKFRNRLPYRKNFNPEIRKAVERIR